MKRKNTKVYSFLFFFVFFSTTAMNIAITDGHAATKNPLAPVKTDNPRDTMRTFMEAMNDYKKGVSNKNDALMARINDAIRCFDLSDVTYLMRKEKGAEAAIFLKEVIDRVIVIDYSKIPEKSDHNDKPLLRWRLKGTEIAIARIEKGERAGEFLFTKDTFHRSKEFFQKVKELPYLKGSGQGAFYKQPWVEKVVPVWAQKKYAGMHLWQWFGIFVSILIGLILKVVVQFLVDILYKIASKSGTDWDNKVINAASGPIGYLFASGFWFATLYILRLEGMPLSIMSGLVQVIISIVAIWLMYRMANVLSEYLSLLAEKTESTLDDQLVPLINRTIKIFTVIIGVLIAVQNLGVNVMSLIAGLGIGGLAFALAAKDMVANLFGSIMILLDRPFQVGDWVIISGAEGTVEEIGFRSTRIRTFYNSVISVPNSELANSKIDNMGMREYRRVMSYIGITYDTPVKKIETFLEGIKKIIQANPYTRKDYFHVVFSRFGSHSLDLMLYFFLKVPDWSNELIEKQNVYLEIIRLAEHLGIRFAFPTQTIYMENMAQQIDQQTDLMASSSELSKDMPNDELKRLAQKFGPNGEMAKPAGQGIFMPPFKE